MIQDMDRRAFLTGAAIGGMALGTAGLFGCSTGSLTPENHASDKTAADSGSAIEDTSIATDETPKDIVETIDTEVCIIGCGLSGLACAVQAASNGNQVLVLEKNALTGGNGNVIEGMFAIGTSLAQKNGVNVTERQVIDHELKFTQYRNNGVLWRTFVEAAKDNWDWCVKQGCEYSGVVDTYGGLLPTFHWFKDGEGSVGYVPQMTKRAKDLGAEIKLSTPAVKLIVGDDGAVKGCYAKNADGDYIQVNAKATVIATGGWGCNPSLISKQGFDTTDFWIGGTKGHDGDGYKMALAAGAMDRLAVSSQLSLNIVPALPRTDFKHPYNGIVGISSGFTPAIWVNQDAVRFVNESILRDNMMFQAIPAREQEAVYTIWDSKIWKKVTSGCPGCNPDAELASALKTNDPASLWSANDISGLAKATGLDAEKLQDAIAEYNADAAAGTGDHVFNRDAQYMETIDTPPYYIARTRLHFVSNFGGFATNLDYAVIDGNKKVIEGLYAAGLDGDMRYRNVYPINMPGTTAGGFIWSGRVAADSIKKFIG